MPLPRHILSVTTNCCQRTTREEILQGAGYHVTSVPSTSDALRKVTANGGAFDLVVICDCTPADDRARFIAALKFASPAVPILLIGEQREMLADDKVGASEGPQALLNHVEALLAS